MAVLDPSKVDRAAQRKARQDAEAAWRTMREEILDDTVAGKPVTAARRAEAARQRAIARGEV